MIHRALPGLLAGILILTAGIAGALEIGSVDTKFNLLSPDDSINVEAFADPKVSGVVCYLSRAQKGGYRGALGLAEDTSDASIDCRQVAPIVINEPFKEGEGVFRERRSLIFKSLKVVRFCDVEHNVLVYLAYSERVIEGSPKNSLSAVPIAPWPGASAEDAANTAAVQCRYQR
ncbi:MAG: CreA family protein [Pseudomonadales bacterium]